MRDNTVVTNVLRFLRLALFLPIFIGHGKMCASSGQKLNSSLRSSDKISTFSQLRLILPEITKVAHKTQKISLVIFGISALLISGCGYAIHSGVRSDIKTINIATFENGTFEHGLEVELSEVLRKEFIVDGILSVADASSADVLLSGEIIEYVREPYTYGADETEVEQYRVRIKANVFLREVGKEKPVWEKSVEEDATYYLTGSLAKTEEEAKELALSELSKEIVSITVRPW